jgi:photosystem II stability/assembly factor-like uncharacterized protein
MKRISIIILFVLQSLTCSLFSQWVQQYTGLVSGDHLLDVSFINKNTGWACGVGGKIIKTTNAGTNWILQNTGITNKNLYGINAVDSQYVYCVGYFQTILKTTNGGDYWQIIRNGTWGNDPSFFGLYFLNRNTGWMLRNEYVIRTTNGCASFDSTHINFSYLRDVYFKDALTGVMCSDGAGVFKSTDGGLSWNQVPVPHYNNGYPDFFKESFIGNTGWILGRGSENGLGCLVFRTTNFGTSWDTIGWAPYPYTLENYCVFFSSLNTGWCGGTNGWMLKSTNGGINWIQQNATGGFKNSLWFYSDSIGWAVGASGLVLYTTTGGQYVGIQPISNKIPSQFNLYQNYPNPFNGQTIIQFNINKSGIYTLNIYDLLGREVEIIINEFKVPGKYQINYNADKLSSGIYIYKLSGNNFLETRKMTLIK